MLLTPFHETKEKFIMFKKTLLAASILGGASFAANAAQIVVTVDEEPTAIETAITGTTGTVNACTAAASTVGATIAPAGFTLDAAATHTVTVTPGTVDGILTDASVTLTAADACTVVVGDQLIGASSAKYSAEGAAVNGVILDVDLVTGIGGVAAEQTIIFTVAGGTVDETLSLGAALTTDAGGLSAFTLTGVVGNTILFSANSDYPTPALPREILNLTGVAVIPNAGVTEVTLSAETTNTAGIVVDNADDEGVTNIAAQYSVSVPAALDGVIDVTNDRLPLTVESGDAFNSTKLGAATPEAANEDTLVVKINVETTQGNLVPASADLVIKGDFSWLADSDPTDDDTVITDAEIQGAAIPPIVFTSHADDNLASDGVATAASYTVNATYDEVTIVITPGTLPSTDVELDPYHTVKLAVLGDATGTPAAVTSLTPNDFLATLTTSDGATGSAVIVPTDTKVGEWSLNGSVVTIPYMPFGPNTKVILRHTSTSNQVGDITVRYILEDMDPSDGDNWVSVGAVETDVANGVLNITSQVMDAIVADAGVEKGKVAIEITTNVPAEDVTVYAAYNVKNSADDRGFVGTFGENGSAGVPVTP
jgi:hypothetical protein